MVFAIDPLAFLTALAHSVPLGSAPLTYTLNKLSVPATIHVFLFSSLSWNTGTWNHHELPGTQTPTYINSGAPGLSLSSARPC